MAAKSSCAKTEYKRLNAGFEITIKAAAFMLPCIRKKLPEAVDTVLQHYTAHIKYLSMYKGRINDDTQGRLKVKLIEAILKFRFDR